MLGRHVHEKRDFNHGGFGIQNRSQKSRAMVLALCTILNVEDLHEITQKGERPHNGHLVRILLGQYRDNDHREEAPHFRCGT